jgi:hypothetical protein
MSPGLTEADVISAANLLKKFDDLARSIDLTYWLDQGTLLEAVRTGSLLPWETDIDVSIWEEDLDKLLGTTRSLRDLGIEMRWYPTRNAVYLSGSGRVYIDVSPHRVEGDFVIKTFVKPKRASWQTVIKRLLNTMPAAIRNRARNFGRGQLRADTIQVAIPQDWFKELGRVTFLGLDDIKVPYDTHGYLEFKFGPDWEVPRQKWNFYKEDGAIVANARGGASSR